MNDTQQKYPIDYVGAGPGDPELITVKGQRLLAEADVIIFTGSLVPKALVEGLRAEIHDSASMTLEEVISLIDASYSAGKKVVRLHTGDPSIYGAINEQFTLLQEHRIPYRVVPGVSSGLAVAAALQTELTLPEVSQTVIFTRRGGRTPVPEKEKLPLLASHRATMLIFLSISMIDDVVAELLAGGYTPDTPAAVVEKVSWPEERILRGELGNLAALVHEAGIRKTAIIAVGQAIGSGPPPALSKLYDRSFSHGYRQGSDE